MGSKLLFFFGGVWGGDWPMRGLKLIMWSEGQWEASKKIACEGNIDNKHTHRRISRLLDQLGPEGRVGEKSNGMLNKAEAVLDGFFMIGEISLIPWCLHTYHFKPTSLCLITEIKKGWSLWVWGLENAWLYTATCCKI